MLTTALLGGSNSVLKAGLSVGLARESHLLNLAIGATTSVQNLAALVRNRADVAAADLVVTESNVNDCAGIKFVGDDLGLVKDNIDRFYQELFFTNPNCLVIIIPLVNPPPKETDAIVAEINQCHLDNARRYGFYSIDLTERWASVPADAMRFLQPEIRHPQQIYLCHLGLEIARYFTVIADRLSGRKAAHQPHQSSGFEIIAADAIDAEHRRMKSNSRFRAQVAIVDKPVHFPSVAHGRRLLAIGTWSDQISAIHLESGEHIIAKPFNTHLAVNEIGVPFLVTPDATLAPFYGRASLLTERSQNMSVRDMQKWIVAAGQSPKEGWAFNHPPAVESLLVMDPDYVIQPAPMLAYASEALDIAPATDPYIASAEHLIRGLRLVPRA